ncbi:hypothetical protein HK101_008070 [Irineochytrium annulatum]|nr:hypothetical protein HK101_008070 [Irineochytrium annulatum]
MLFNDTTPLEPVTEAIDFIYDALASCGVLTADPGFAPGPARQALEVVADLRHLLEQTLHDDADLDPRPPWWVPARNPPLLPPLTPDHPRVCRRRFLLDTLREIEASLIRIDDHQHTQHHPNTHPRSSSDFIAEIVHASALCGSLAVMASLECPDEEVALPRRPRSLIHQPFKTATTPPDPPFQHSPTLAHLPAEVARQVLDRLATADLSRVATARVPGWSSPARDLLRAREWHDVGAGAARDFFMVLMRARSCAAAGGEPFRHVRRLTLMGAGMGAVSFARRCRGLRSLCVSYEWAPEEVEAVVRACPRIMELEVRRCPRPVEAGGDLSGWTGGIRLGDGMDGVMMTAGTARPAGRTYASLETVTLDEPQGAWVNTAMTILRQAGALRCVTLRSWSHAVCLTGLPASLPVTDLAFEETHPDVVAAVLERSSATLAGLELSSSHYAHAADSAPNGGGAWSRALAALARCGALRRLRATDLQAGGEDAFVALAAMKPSFRLEELEADDDHRSLLSLLGAPCLSGIRRLRLSCYMADTALGPLAELKGLKSLAVVDWRGFEPESLVKGLVASLETLQEVEDLEVNFTDIEERELIWVERLRASLPRVKKHISYRLLSVGLKSRDL